MDFLDQMPFDNALTEHLDKGDIIIVEKYRNRYLECQGDIDLLAPSLADDLHRIWGSPEPAQRFKKGISIAAVSFGIMSQAATASVFGDSETETKLKGLLR
jgi:hypothetical protein